MIDAVGSLETFDRFVQHVDGVLQAKAGSNVIAFDLEHGRCATWRRARFRIRVWPTQVGVVAMIELDQAYRDDFLESRTLQSAHSLGERFAELLAS